MSVLFISFNFCNSNWALLHLPTLTFIIIALLYHFFNFLLDLQNMIIADIAIYDFFFILAITYQNCVDFVVLDPMQILAISLFLKNMNAIWLQQQSSTTRISFIILGLLSIQHLPFFLQNLLNLPFHLRFLSRHISILKVNNTIRTERQYNDLAIISRSIRVRHDSNPRWIIVDQQMIIISELQLEQGFHELQVIRKWMFCQINLFNFSISIWQVMEY